MTGLFRWMTGAVLVALAVAWSPGAVRADDPPPPAVGNVILEDDLSGPTLFRPYACKTRRGGLDYVGEGLRLKSDGPCNDGDIIAASIATIRGLEIPDGEIRVEAKAVGGIERARIGIDARTQPINVGPITSLDIIPPIYAVAVEPGRYTGLAGLPGKTTLRRDVEGIVTADDWNAVAIRMQGPNIWLMLNDQPILFYSDTQLDRGGAFFDLVRVSDGPQDSVTDPNDTTEVAVVYRNLKVSALAEGDPARVPTYRRP
jgi:hypothetical protein